MPVPSPDYDLFTSFRYDPKLLTAPYNTEVNGIELPYLLFVYHVDRLVAAATKFGWTRAVQTMKACGVSERLRHMCDQTVMECGLPDKEKGLGVSSLSMFVSPDKADQAILVSCIHSEGGGPALRVLLSSTGDLNVEVRPARRLSRDLLRAAYFNPSATPSPSAASLPAPIFTVYLDTRPTPASAFTAHKTTSAARTATPPRARRGLKDRAEPKEVLLYNERGEITEGSARNAAFWRDGAWVTPAERCGGLPGTVRRYLLERGLVKEGVVRAADVRAGEWVLLSNGCEGTLLGRVVRD
ncbi:aminotransferase [Phellopilus nigrolimitatus]|nr:aminotransferase [Phellopilus nigrolimitatus]